MTNTVLPSSETKLFRSQRYAVLGGVCAGIALTRGYSINLVRLIALLLASTGVGLLLYIVLWLVLPKAHAAGIEEPQALPVDTLQRNSKDAMIAGVCSGLATYFKIDKSLVRVIFALVLVCAGIGFVPYLYAWIALPKRYA